MSNELSPKRKMKHLQRHKVIVLEIEILNYIINRQKADIFIYRQKLDDLKMGIVYCFGKRREEEMMDTRNANLEDGVYLKDKYT